MCGPAGPLARAPNTIRPGRGGNDALCRGCGTPTEHDSSCTKREPILASQEQDRESEIKGQKVLMTAIGPLDHAKEVGAC